MLCLLMAWTGAGAYQLEKFTLESCYRDIFPGTEREITVSIPEGYDGTTPACVYVGLDGILCDAPAVIDSLIAAGLMPMTVGVYIQPGVITGKDGEVIRYNRSNEFDTPSPTLATFIETCVLPRVEEITTAGGVPLRLSHDGNDRMIFGLSSGGIAAFTAAWHRPDLFSRVFSGVGTFVAMRGGNDLQAMVRKSEPRPIRVFLQDGTNDVWNALFGHWYEGNRMLASALDFAGYEARYDWSDCYHGVKRANEIFANVMTWMWSGWPQRPATGTTANNLLDTMLVEGNRWQRIDVATQPQWQHEATYPDGSLVARNFKGSNDVWQFIINDEGLEDHGQPFYHLHSYDNSQLTVAAMAFDGSGNLWVVTNAGIQICDQNGRVRGILMLPAGLNADDVKVITIGNDEVLLHCSRGVAYRRTLHVTAPTPGKRPASQGQG